MVVREDNEKVTIIFNALGLNYQTRISLLALAPCSSLPNFDFFQEQGQTFPAPGYEIPCSSVAPREQALLLGSKEREIQFW